MFAINFEAGTVGVVEADGMTAPMEPVVVYYKARFTDGWLTWIRRIGKTEADRELSGGRW